MIESLIETQLVARGIKDERVLSAFREVPRDAFVPEEYREQAYEDHPLPIGHGQTISQPYMVAMMTELLRAGPQSRVLEVGTGSGYQTAIVARLAEEVYSIEIVSALHRQAAALLARLGYLNVHLRLGDGYRGWPEYAPYDGIIVTCAAPHVPQPLVAQLANGGRMVVPVGAPAGAQVLLLIRRKGERLVQRRVIDVAFVPLLRDAE